MDNIRQHEFGQGRLADKRGNGSDFAGRLPPTGDRCAMAAGGFTLVELLVTITIAIILMSIAIPNYRGYVIRANRSDATTTLLRIAAAQEKFYIQNNTYTTDLSDTGLGIPGTEKGYYDLTVAAAAGGLTAGYTATATARAGERQASDAKCQTFTVNERGSRGSSPEDIETCWK